jgi:hypothetical protein
MVLRIILIISLLKNQEPDVLKMMLTVRRKRLSARLPAIRSARLRKRRSKSLASAFVSTSVLPVLEL